VESAVTQRSSKDLANVERNMPRLVAPFVISGLVLSASMAVGAPSGEERNCAMTSTNAIRAYYDWVKIEEPDRIRTLDRGKFWLVFQGSVLRKSGSPGLVAPAPGAHHLAKVDKCDGTVLPYED